MKALLDEQLSPQIAMLLRKAGCDALAGGERDDLLGRSDRTILEVATSEGRAVVTNNIKDFRPLAVEWLAKGRTHGGLILLPSSRTRSRWRDELDQRIHRLQQLRDAFTDCIGCGCLSIDRCMLANPHDALGRHGAGPRRLLES